MKGVFERARCEFGQDTDKGIVRSALFAPDGARRHRLVLHRAWGPGPTAVVIGLNPSTAGGHEDDATIRALYRIATHNGYGSLMMLNAYTLIATDPNEMVAAGPNAIHPQYNEYLRFLLTSGHTFDTTIVAWGANINRAVPSREGTLLAALRNAGVSIRCFGMTKGGYPKHPLYLPTETSVQRYPL